MKKTNKNIEHGDKTKIAERMGKTPAYLTMILNGQRKMSKSVMIELQGQTGVDFKVWMEATPEQLAKLLKHHLLSTR